MTYFLQSGLTTTPIMKPIALLVAAQLASAHFGVEYPEWRANTLDSEHEEYSQWIYPCRCSWWTNSPDPMVWLTRAVPDIGANVPAGAGNRTDWPLEGGSLKLDLHHPWTYIFVNLGLGDNVTNFNYTLTPEFWNSTGKGTLCVPDLPLPADLSVSDGTKASIQVVTLGESGSALYNVSDLSCRDKTLRQKFGIGDPG